MSVSTSAPEESSHLLPESAPEATASGMVDDQLIVLSRAVAHSPVSILITDTKGNIKYVNPKFTQVTGYTSEEVRGKTPRLLKSGKISPEVYKDLWETITAGGDWRGELCNKKKNGELYWDFAWISPIRNAEGRVTHYLGIQEDITERKLAQEAVTVNLALQRVRNEILSMEKPEDWEKVALACRRELDPLVRFAGCSIILVNLQQRTGKAYYCPSPGKTEVRSYASIHPLFISTVASGHPAYRRTRAEIERGEERIPPGINSVIDIPFASGTLAVNSTAENAFSEREIRILEQFAQVLSEAHRRLQDLQVIETERKQAEEAVQKNAESIRAIAAALPDLLFVLDEQGRYLEVLTSQENLLYAETQKIKGHLMHEILPQEAADLFMEVVRKTIATSKPQVVEYTLDVQEGTRYFEGRTAPLPEVPGERKAVVWVSRDITERKQAEEAAHQAQERLQHLVFSSPAVIYALGGGQFRLSYVSENLEQMAGWTPRKPMRPPGGSTASTQRTRSGP